MKQLLILSGKGGTGKTTLAGAFIKLSDVDAYADCDVDAPNLHLITQHCGNVQKSDFFGLPKAELNQLKCIKCDECRKRCRYGAISVVDDKYIIDYYACEGCGVCAYVCPTDAIKMKDDVAGNLELYKNGKIFSTAQLRMGSGTSGLLVSKVKGNMSSAVPKETKLAIIDGSPGIGCPVIASLSGVDMVLIVAEPSISGISDMERIVKTANHFGTKIAVTVNKADTNEHNTKEIEKYCVENKIDFVGTIPYDSMAVDAVNNGLTIVDIKCPAGEATKTVYNRCLDILRGLGCNYENKNIG